MYRDQRLICVKEKRTEKISRIPRDKANSLVAKGTHTFSSKSAFKKQTAS